MIYTSTKLIESQAPAVIIPVSGTEFVEEGGIHEQFIAECELGYTEHYFREVRVGMMGSTTRVSLYFVKEGPWAKRWIIELPVKPSDRWGDLGPKVDRIAKLLGHLELDTIAVSHMKCQITEGNQESIWQWYETVRLDSKIEFEFHTQEIEEVEASEPTTTAEEDLTLETVNALL